MPGLISRNTRNNSSATPLTRVPISLSLPTALFGGSICPAKPEVLGSSAGSSTWISSGCRQRRRLLPCTDSWAARQRPGGAAIGEAQREFRQIERDRRVRGALPEAWERVLSDPEGLIIDLLIDAVKEISGHPPSKETVTEFLAGKLGPVNVEPPPTSVRTSRRRVRGTRSASAGRSATASTPASSGETTGAPAPTSFKGRRVAAYRLDGVRHEVNSWRDLLPRLCGQLAREAGRAFPQAVTRLEGQPYLRTSAPDSPDWIRIGGTDRYVYVNITADVAVDRSRRILRAVRGSDDGFHIESVGQEAPASGASSAREKAPATPPHKSLTGLRPAAFVLDGARHEVSKLAADACRAQRATRQQRCRRL